MCDYLHQRKLGGCPGQYSTTCLWSVQIVQQEWAKVIAGAMLECSVWSNVGSIAILQEVCQEPSRTMFQAQPV